METLYSILLVWNSIQLLIIVSTIRLFAPPLYEIFYVSRKDILLPEYLNMFVKRDEFARLCEFLDEEEAQQENISCLEPHRC